MNEIIVGYNRESPQKKGAEIKINILDKPKEDLLFKYIVGLDGAWETLKDFSYDETVLWNPKKEGNYIFMVQGKKNNSTKSFDYVSKYEYTIERENNDHSTLIKNLFLNKEQYSVGEKVHLRVETNKEKVLYRYFLKENERWILTKDYCTENTFVFSVKEKGNHEILVQCKSIHSDENFEDAKKIEYSAISEGILKIKNFKCLNSKFLVDEELAFEVQVDYESDKVVLYKFVKINSSGQAECIQDYSTKNILTYKEKQPGEYRVLCLAKDMYSLHQYDDRALIYYNVIPYEKVKIASFSSDVSSPQVVEENVIFKAIVSGGRELRYRYLIEGPKNEDSGYINPNEYLWVPKEPGEYSVTLYAKDVSCDEQYEDFQIMNFTVDKLSRDPVKINDIILEGKEQLLLHESTKIKVLAEGGIDLLYSFIIKRDNVEEKTLDYCECSWMEFTATESGKFEIEIRVKDRYSDKLFDVHDAVHINAYKYMPAKIDYILMEPKEYYLVGEQINIDVISQNTCDDLFKYVLKINGHEVEETDYVKNKKYKLKPRCSGRYSIKIYGKNKESDRIFDCEKEIEILVNDAPPVTNTRLKCNGFEFLPDEPIGVCAESDGGKDVIYEFYLMENKHWNLVQKYSRKNYYDFIPFKNGIYKILVLAKSSYKKNMAYEDYCTVKVKVTETPILRNLEKDKNLTLSKEILGNKALVDFSVIDT